eukprot:3144977-Amphidinium_carterae.1
MEALGVVVSFADIRNGQIHVSNKASRVEEITNAALALIGEGLADRRTLESLRGRILFAQGQHYNRLGCVAVRTLSEAARTA